MSLSFLERLDSDRPPLLSDGAMGTILNARGVSVAHAFDALNIEKPDLVRQVHGEYLAAGAEVIQTNTFGANRYKLGLYGQAGQVRTLNQAGAGLARQAAAQAGSGAFVLGDVGPLGVRLAPFGRVQPEQARRAFAEQIAALAEAGVDALILETFSDVWELGEAIAAARQVCRLALVASVTFTRDDLTVLGDTPAQAARQLAEYGADVLGVNCSGGPAQVLRILRQMRQAVPKARLSAMPNAGWPEQVGGRIMYPSNPAYYGDYAMAFCEAGARLMGGCCGTTPQHIAAMRAVLDAQGAGCGALIGEDALPERETAAEEHQAPSPLAQRLQEGRFVMAVEMDPPRGLSTHKLLAGAGLLAEAGADVINVADSPMARMRMSPWAVCQLIQRTVQADTTLHFPTRGRNLLRVQGDLLAAHALGLRNVFVVMGDPTAIGDYPDAMDDYDLAPSGLIKLIKHNFNLGHDHAGEEIGRPTSFFVGCALNLCPADPAAEIKTLRRKLKAGADFALTQPVFDPPQAHAFLEQYAAQYGPLPIPVLAGVLPLFSPRHAAFLHNEVPGIDIPEALRERIQQAGAQAPAEGVRIAGELIEQMRPWAQGIYLMPQFGRYDLAAQIVEQAAGRRPALV